MIKLSLNQWIQVGRKKGWLSKEAVRQHAIERIQLRGNESTEVLKRAEFLEKKLSYPGLNINGLAADILDLGYANCIKLPEREEYTCGDTITAVIRRSFDGKIMETVTVTYRRTKPELYHDMEKKNGKNLKEILKFKGKNILYSQPLTPDYFRVDEVLTLQEVIKWMSGVIPSKIFKRLPEKDQNRILANIKQRKQEQEQAQTKPVEIPKQETKPVVPNTQQTPNIPKPERSKIVPRVPIQTQKPKDKDSFNPIPIGRLSPSKAKEQKGLTFKMADLLKDIKLGD